MMDGMPLRYKGGRQTCLLLEVALRALGKKGMLSRMQLCTATAAGQICCELNKNDSRTLRSYLQALSSGGTVDRAWEEVR